jgi:endoglucanase
MQTNASQIQFSSYTQKDIADIKSLGCDVIRLPIDFYSMNSGSPNYTVDPLLLTYLDQTITMAEEKQMYLILDNQPVDVEAACQNPNLGTSLTKVWTQLATRYKNRSLYVITK